MYGQRENTAAEGSQRKPLHEYPSIEKRSAIHSHFGIDTTRFNAISWLSDDTVLMSAGKFVLFVNIRTGAVESQDGPEDGAVGVVAVHPSRKYYVVGERRPRKPRVVVHEWPSRSELHSFEEGCNVGFAACAFDKEGKHMATVGASPDFTLAVWDWHNKSMILRSKCFSTDVQTVVFSPFDNSILVSGGSGHIKFWTMAETFTGLKLQGTLGKFGRLEISNETGFAVFADGKVLSGSENGCLLLWEGDLVKTSFVRSIDQQGDDIGGALSTNAATFTPCHAGTINVVMLMYDGKIVVSAGDDGYIRYWNRAEMDVAEGEGQPPLYVPKCLLEVCVGPNLQIRSITLCESSNEWAILDANGVIATSPLPSLAEIKEGTMPERSTPPSKVKFNGGGVLCCAISPNSHTVITGGEDGVVRLVDYILGVEVSSVTWPPADPAAGPLGSPISVLHYFTTDKTQSTFLVAQEDGTIRLMKLNENRFSQVGHWKPHASGLFALAVQRDEKRLCTVSRNGTVFFFDIAEDLLSLSPIGFCQTPLEEPLCVEWDEEGNGCFVGYEGGQILCIQCPNAEEVDRTVSFEFECTYSLLGIRQRRLPPPPEDDRQLEDDVDDILEEEDNGPWAVNLIRRLPDGTIAIGMRMAELLYQFRGTVRYPGLLQLPPLPPTGVEPPNYVEDPEENLCYRDMVPQSVFLGPTKKELIIVCEHSQVIVRDAWNLKSVSLCGMAHDSTCGHITGAQTSYDDSMLITTGTDGLVVAQLRKGHTAPESTKREVVEVLEKLTATEVCEATPVLSIQEQKEADDKAEEAAIQQMKLDKFLSQIDAIHGKYAELLDRNAHLPEDVRLDEDDIVLDPSLKEKLEAEKQSRVSEAQKEFAVEAAREDVRTKKLRNRFMDNLLADRFVVHAFSGEFTVCSFRTVNPAAAFKRLQKDIASLDDDDGDEENEEDGGDESAEAKLARQLTLNLPTRTDNEDALRNAANDDYLKTKINSTIKQQLDKADERKAERHNRRVGYEQLLARQPDSKDDEIALQDMLRKDIDARGECVLRTDPHYRGSKDFRPTAAAKLNRMMNLELALVEKRTAFNQKVLKFREEKARKIVAINNFRQRISAINTELDDFTVESQPLSLAVEEQPEVEFIVTRDSLDAFAKQKALDRMKEEEAKKAQRGFGADLAGAPQQEVKNSESAASSPRASRRTMSKGRQSTAFFTNAERMNIELKAKLENIKPTEMEEEETAMRRERLFAERRRLAQECRRLMEQFDDSLYGLYRIHVDVDADLCLADAHLLLLFREYQMLLVFRTRDAELRNVYRSLKQDREKERKSITTLKSDMEKLEATLAGMQEKLKANRQTSEAYIHEFCPADKVPYILKVFHRHIKRKKNVEDDDLNDDITSDDEDDEYEIEDDIGEEICPANCEVEHWEKMLEFRETRLDITDDITENKANQDTCKKGLAKTEAEVETLLAKMKECQTQIEALENEKRKELNLLYTVVPLWCDQVKCLTEDLCCPVDIHNESVLVVAEEELVRLGQRVRELAEQKENRRAEIADMSAELQRLQEDKAATQRVHSQWEAKVNEVMMLKFGRLVDLEMLETCGSSRRIEAKKEELRRREIRWEREIRKQENAIATLRERMHGQLIENTHLLQDLGDRENDRQFMERSLGNATTRTVQRYRGDKVATKKDRENLRDLITAQQEEMDALNAEIMMLRRKGGHAYSPAM